jgi:glutamine amidotransferase
MVHPIIDEYYNYNPYHSRSSKFVRDKGLITNEKGTSTPTPVRSTTPSRPEIYRLRSALGSSLHESLASTLVAASSPALSPTTENLLTFSTRELNRPQEMTNTKKKRKSLTPRDREPQVQAEVETPIPDSPPQRTAYGDPNKIAQYFPELN